jgi:hypothetical protein
MRNVKVNVQADTSQALGRVRELTGALAQLDSATKRNVQSLLQALGSAGLHAQQIGTVQNQQAAASKAQSAVSKSAPAAKADDIKKQADNSDTAKKINDAMQSLAGKNLDLFVNSFAKAIGDVFTNLSQGKFKDAFKGLKTSLQGLFGELMSQLVTDVVGMMKKSIVSGLKGILSTAGRSGASSVAETAVQKIALPAASGLQIGLPDTAGNQVDGSDAGTGRENVSWINPQTKNFIPVPNTDEFRRQNPVYASIMGMGGPDVPKPDVIKPANSGAPKPVTQDAVTNAAKTTDQMKCSWGSLGKMLGSMAPALGSSLGGMLGGSSTVGSLLGSAGGLFGGLAVSSLLSGGMTGANLSSGIFGSLAHIAGAAGATGIGLAVAAAFMIGAFFLGRDKQRKTDEKTRNQAMVDSFQQLDELLRQVNADEIEGSAGVSQANNIRSQYMDQMSKLKDSKTRNIALKDVSRIDDKISLIKAAASNQTSRKALDAKLVPTFADGGFVGGYKVLGGDGSAMTPFQGRVPGVYDRRDDFLARLTGNEVVLTPNVWMPIAPYLRQKRVPGFADGGAVSNISSFTGSVNTSDNQSVIIEELIINLSNQFGAETAAKILDVGVKTPDGRQAVVKSVRTHIGESGLGDGLVRDINRVNSRGF